MDEFAPTLIKQDAKASIRCRLLSCTLPSFKNEFCLIAEFSGEIEEGTTFDTGYRYIHAMIGDGFAACNPATLLLDLSGLVYESGDAMCKVLDQRIITKTVVSDLNRQGLTRLISSTLFLDPCAELFDTAGDALHACDQAYQHFLRDGRKKMMASDF